MKKLLSILIVCVFLTLCPAFSVSSADKTANTNTNMRFLKSLSILKPDEDGNYPKDDVILTRYELARLFYGIFIDGDIPDFSDAAPVFSDVPEEQNEVVRAVSGMGIMKGSGDGLFNGDAGVTYIQLLKTMVSFLGYDGRAEGLGGWPMGYYAMASQFGLVNNPPADMNYYITLSGAADVFRAAADVDMMIQDTYNDGPKTVHKDTNYLKYYLGIETARGVVTANTITDFDSSYELAWGKVKIDGVTMNTSSDVVELYNMLGQRVTVFYTEEDGGPEIKYFENYRNTVDYFADEEITEVQSDKIVYTREGSKKDFSLKLSKNAVIVYNGTVLKSYGTNELNPFKGQLDGGITCIDNDNDGVCDVMLIDAYQTFVCGGIKDNIANSRIIEGVSVDLSEFGENSIAVLNAIGEPIKWSDIAVDDILNLYRDLNGNVKKIVVTIDSAEGIVNEIERSGDGLAKIRIGDKYYECANSLSQYKDARDLKTGDLVTVYFNPDAKIGALEKGSHGYKIGLLTVCGQDEGLDEPYKVKILGANGLFGVYELKDKIKINGKTVEAKTIVNAAEADDTGKIERQVIQYNVDEDGNLLAIDFPTTDPVDSDGEYTSDFFQIEGFDGSKEYDYHTEMSSFSSLKAGISDSTYVFIIPDDSYRSYDELYMVKKGDYLKSGWYTVKAYGTDKKSTKVAALVYEDNTATEGDVNTASEIMVIESIKTVYDEQEGQSKIVVTGNYYETSSSAPYGSFEVEDENILRVGPNKTLPESGDTIKYALDATGKIVKAKLILDKSENALYNTANPSEVSYPSSAMRYSYGDIVYNDGEFITVELHNYNGNVTRESYPIWRFRSNGITYTADPSGNTGTLKSFMETDIYDRATYGDGCSKVFVQLEDVWWYFGVIYNE